MWSLDFSIAPCIAFHYSTLFEEHSFFEAKVVKLRKPLPAEFIQAVSQPNFNVGVVYPEGLGSQIDTLLTGYSVYHFIEYGGSDGLNRITQREDLQEIAISPRWRIARYYDNDTKRGQIFGGEVWRPLTV